MHASKPLKTFREGAVCASVWLSQTNGRVFYDVSFSRSSKQRKTFKPGYFSHRHIDSLIDLAIEAQVWILERQAKATGLRLGKRHRSSGKG